jgi:DNA-binding NarL/FixJ family response regulator
MTEQRTIRVVLVDDHHMFRTGVRAELTGLASSAAYGDAADPARRPASSPAAPRLQIVGEAGAVESATAVITQEQPDVVLLDVHLPGGDGHGGADVIRACNGVQSRAGTPVRFLALSVSDAAEDVIAVIRAGARGYVTKTISAEDLLTAITRVADGDAVFSPRLAGFVLDAFGAAAGEVAEIDEELDRLSAREREVMRLIARGYQYKEVAKELFISVKTVETHVSSVLRKLQLSSRHELTAWAMGRRLL